VRGESEDGVGSHLTAAINSDCGSRGDGRAGDAVGISGEEQGTRWGGGISGRFLREPAARHGERPGLEIGFQQMGRPSDFDDK
jgi:hypothetical protein